MCMFPRKTIIFLELEKVIHVEGVQEAPPRTRDKKETDTRF